MHSAIFSQGRFRHEKCIIYNVIDCQLLCRNKKKPHNIIFMFLWTQINTRQVLEEIFVNLGILIIKSKAISGPPCRAWCDESDSVNQSARRADCWPHKQTVGQDRDPFYLSEGLDLDRLLTSLNLAMKQCFLWR